MALILNPGLNLEVQYCIWLLDICAMLYCRVYDIQIHIWYDSSVYSTNHVYLHRFSRLRLKRKTHPAFRVLNVFYFQTDFNLRFKHLTSHITHSNGYAPYIAYYRSNGFDQRFRKLKPKPKLNLPNAHRSQIKICENAFAKNQMRLANEDKRDLYCKWTLWSCVD